MLRRGYPLVCSTFLSTATYEKASYSYVMASKRISSETMGILALYLSANLEAYGNNSGDKKYNAWILPAQRRLYTFKAVCLRPWVSHGLRLDGDLLMPLGLERR